MPSPSVSPVTLPNSVRMPTFPVGTETTLAKKRKMNKTNRNNLKILDPAPLRFGIAGILPPKSNPFVVFATGNLRRIAATPQGFLPYFYYVRRARFVSSAHARPICHPRSAVVASRVPKWNQKLFLVVSNSGEFIHSYAKIICCLHLFLIDTFFLPRKNLNCSCGPSKDFLSRSGKFTS